MSIPEGIFMEDKTDFRSKSNHYLKVQQINPEIYKRSVNENGTEINNRIDKYFNRINIHHWSIYIGIGLSCTVTMISCYSIGNTQSTTNYL